MVFDSLKGEPRAKKMLLGAHKNGKVAGAYLFQGQNIDEMSDAATEYARLLNCETACHASRLPAGQAGQSGGQCLNCRKIAADTHPDFITIVPEGKKQVIKIDAVRDLKSRVKLGPTEAKYLVIKVIRADSIEDAAANSFLKALEEPPAGVVFILIVSSDNLPKTVLSRCQKVIFANQPEEQAIACGLPDGCDIPSLLKFSAGLAILPKESERQEAELKLQALIEHFFKKREFLKARAIMKAVKDLKQNANIKLLLDRMALSLGGWIQCSE
jgi:DNA polymerase III delta prime subunit